MQVYKPITLGLQTRCIEYRRRIGLCVTATVYFPFDPSDRGTAWAEPSMWNFLGQEMTGGPVLDEGVVKLKGEFLVHGKAHPPRADSPGCVVMAQVGHLRKVAHVHGRRRWVNGQAGPPEFLKPTPLDWAHAYGGEGFDENPMGVGHKPQKAADGSMVHWLPQIVSADESFVRPDRPMKPVAFGAIDLTWPQRAQHRGTYDERWLRSASPGYADDLDWRFFQMAPEDQRFDKPLRGDEAFEFGHMHPTKTVVGGRLPSLRAIAFVVRGQPQVDSELVEVPLSATTAWFFPHAERGVLIFHGLVPCDEDDGSDIGLLMGGLERLDEAKPIEHYHDAYRQRIDPKTSMIATLRDADLLPKGMTGTDPDFEAIQADYRPEGLMGDAQHRGLVLNLGVERDRAIAAGASPESVKLPDVSKPKLPTLEELPDVIRKAQADAVNARALALCEAMEAALAAKQQMLAKGMDPTTAAHRGPPTFRAATELQRLQAQVASSGLTSPVDFKSLTPQFFQVEGQEREAYRLGAHTQPPAPPMDPKKAAMARQAVIDAKLLGRSLLGVNLTGADLSGLDLSGLDFTSAWLESANLKGARLDKTCFAMAVLAHADLSEVEGAGADFSQANLAKSKLHTARLRDCKLDEAILLDTPLAETDFQGSSLDRAQLIGASYGLADWRRVQAGGLLFHKAELKSLVLRQSRLQQPVFVECDLTDVDFSGAELVRPTFVQCRGSGVKFRLAKLAGAVFTKGCLLDGADFTQADLTGANLRGTSLEGALLDGASLKDADLSECRLQGSTLVGADARGSLFVKTLLAGAQASQLNAMNAILQRADLSGFRAAEANFYGADLSRVVFDDQTLLPGANLDRARTWPRRPDQPIPAPIQ